MLSWIVSLLIGAAGGNLAGLVLKEKSLGYLWNSVVGIFGAFIGVFILSLVGLSGAGIIADIIAAFIGGGVLLYIVSLIKK